MPDKVVERLEGNIWEYEIMELEDNMCVCVCFNYFQVCAHVNTTYIFFYFFHHLVFGVHIEALLFQIRAMQGPIQGETLPPKIFSYQHSNSISLIKEEITSFIALHPLMLSRIYFYYYRRTDTFFCGSHTLPLQL